MDGFPGAEGGPDADGEADVAVFGEGQGTDSFQDMTQGRFEGVALDSGHDEQELVSPVADQFIAGADVVFEFLGEAGEHFVPGGVAITVVVGFEIIKVEHGHPSAEGGILDFLFVEPPVVYAGEDVGVGFLVVLVDSGEQFLLPGEVDDVPLVEFAEEFHHAGLPVDFKVAGNHVVDPGFGEFDFPLVLLEG